MRPTIRPTSAEMEETEEEKNNYDETEHYMKERRLIGLRIEETFWGKPRFILEKVKGHGAPLDQLNLFS